MRVGEKINAAIQRDGRESATEVGIPRFMHYLGDQVANCFTSTSIECISNFRMAKCLQMSAFTGGRVCRWSTILESAGRARAGDNSVMF